MTDPARAAASIQRAARSFRGQSYPDLVAVGWLSYLVRGSIDGVRHCQAAYAASERTAR